MQDGYHFATAPRLIGDGQTVDAAADLRQGQIVRIVHEPQLCPPVLAQAADVAAPPNLLLAAGRLWDSAAQDAQTAQASDRAATPDAPADTAGAATEPGDIAEIIAALFAQIAMQQDAALARIEAAQQRGLDLIDQHLTTARPAQDPAAAERLELTLATLLQARVDQADALHEVANVFDAMSEKILSLPHQHDRLLREVTDIRSSLTELRVQMRLIEVQFLATSRSVPGSVPGPLQVPVSGAHHMPDPRSYQAAAPAFAS